jgi:Flp pilus assembly pilin Flp
VSKWGYGLLIAFVALGVCPVPWRKAGRLASLLSVAVIAYAFHHARAI